MPINPTQLRGNLYKILDQVLATQQPIEVVRNGKLLEISAKNIKKPLGLAALKPHPNTINGDPESLVHNDWSIYWKGAGEL